VQLGRAAGIGAAVAGGRTDEQLVLDPGVLDGDVELADRGRGADGHPGRAVRVHLEQGGLSDTRVEEVGACAEEDPDDEDPGGGGPPDVPQPDAVSDLAVHRECGEAGAAADPDQ
jgi:hypothetical protein